jgi:DNA gyrase subunit B
MKRKTSEDLQVAAMVVVSEIGYGREVAENVRGLAGACTGLQSPLPRSGWRGIVCFGKIVPMDGRAVPPRNTTHDWAIAVDAAHLALIRRDPAAFAPGGVRHLVLEVVAYAADEAGAVGGGRCTVTYCRDGSVSVSDDGRGTDTRHDGRGRRVRKPVMSTKDLRFFDLPGAQMLPDGYPRRGISVVAALSEWLVHASHRQDGAWAQRYDRGIPVTGLMPVPGSGTTGTTVHFRPDETVPASGAQEILDASLLAASWPELTVEIRHEHEA